MAGLDVPSKLRRGIGQGNVIPAEVIGRKMLAYDEDRDGALLQHEAARFLLDHGVGGPWFCDMVARTLWNFCTTWFSRDVTWIKISALAWMLHNAMKAQPRAPRRYRITPEGAMGYVPLEPMDGKPTERAQRNPPPRGPGQASTSGAPSRGAPSGARPGGPGPRGQAPSGGPRRGPAPAGRPAASSGPSGARPGARPGPRPGPRRPGPGPGPGPRR